MQKTLHLLLGVGISPLQRWNRRSLSSFACFSKSKSAPSYSSSSALSSSHPRLQFWPFFPHQRGCFRSVQMSAAKGSESLHDADGGSTSAAVASPVAHKPNIRFCQTCGGPTKQVIPDGEEKIRAVCTSCGRIHYENPKMVVGCLVEHDDKVLLCKRSIEPSHGLWTLPAGYLEIGESAAEGAIRETLEEACADVEVLSPFAQLDIPRIGQSYIIFRAKLRRPQFSPGPESSECALFALEDIPFDSLAFSSIFVTLKLYIEDIKVGDVKFHYCTINKRPGASPSDPNGFSVDYHLRC